MDERDVGCLIVDTEYAQSFGIYNPNIPCLNAPAGCQAFSNSDGTSVNNMHTCLFIRKDIKPRIIIQRKDRGSGNHGGPNAQS